MKPRRGYFSLIQYMPDAGRLEAVNLGVVLFVPGQTCLVTMRADNRRLLRFFPEADTSRVIIAAEAVVTRMHGEWRYWDNMVDMAQFATSRGNQIHLCPPRPITLRETDEVELQRLYDELVADTTQPLPGFEK